jgi:hypothetical protein
MIYQKKSPPALARWEGLDDNTLSAQDTAAGPGTKARRRGKRKAKRTTPKQAHMLAEWMLADSLSRVGLDDAQRALVMAAARSMATARARWALHNARLSLYKQALEVGQ